MYCDLLNSRHAISNVHILIEVGFGLKKIVILFVSSLQCSLIQSAFRYQKDACVIMFIQIHICVAELCCLCLQIET